ncbi:hypothetical protein Gpo141_00003492 [Globisporangium polare]
MMSAADEELPLHHHHHQSSDDDGSGSSSGASQQQHRRLLLLKTALAALAVVVALLLLSLLPVKVYVLALSSWVKTHTFLGTFAVILFFWTAIPLCIPSTVLEAITGSLFGVVHGLVVILIGKTGGSLLTFLLGRKLGKAMLGDYLTTKFPTFRALSAVLTSQSSWKPLLLFQLSSIPNVVKCYGLAITNVSSFRFAVSSAVGGLPHAVLWANIGDQASDIASIVSGQSELSSSRLAMLVGGAVVTAVAMALLVVYTRKQLAELQKRECRSGSEEESYLLNLEPSEPLIAMHAEENELSKTRAGSLFIV